MAKLVLANCPRTDRRNGNHAPGFARATMTLLPQPRKGRQNAPNLAIAGKSSANRGPGTRSLGRNGGKIAAAFSSFPAIAGKGDHPGAKRADGGRGAGRNETSATTVTRQVRRPSTTLRSLRELRVVPLPRYRG